MKEIRIVMLGGRQYPARYNVFQDRKSIKEIILLTTPQRKDDIKTFISTIPEDLKKRVNKEQNYIINPDDYTKSKQILMKIIKNKPEPVKIDITIAPKIPSIAAWDVAKMFNASILYTPVTGEMRNIFYFKNGKITPRMVRKKIPSVNEYLSLYGRKPLKSWNLGNISIKKPIENSLKELAEYLLSKESIGVRFLLYFRYLINRLKPTKMPYININSNLILSRNHKFRFKVHPEEFKEIFEYLQEMDFISGLKINIDSELSVILQINKHNIDFLNGKWIEFLVYHKLKNSEIFGDCDFSLRISTGVSVNELDFIGISKKGFVYVIECKSGHNVERKDLDILSTTVSLIGGKSVIKYFLWYKFKENITSIKLRKLETHARERDTILLLADDLISGDLLNKIKNPPFLPI